MARTARDLGVRPSEVAEVDCPLCAYAFDDGVVTAARMVDARIAEDARIEAEREVQRRELDAEAQRLLTGG